MALGCCSGLSRLCYQGELFGHTLRSHLERKKRENYKHNSQLWFDCDFSSLALSCFQCLAFLGALNLGRLKGDKRGAKLLHLKHAHLLGNLYIYNIYIHA